MNHTSNHWGIELEGANEDKNVWRMLLKPPYDPYVEEVLDERGKYLVLRSTTFDETTGAKDVHQLAKNLFKILNVVMSKHSDADHVTNGAVIEFVSNGQPRKHRILEAESGTYRIRGGLAQLTMNDAEGKVIEPPPAASQAQLWMHAAKLNPEIGSAIRYLEGKPSWIELYKAWEALEHLPNGGISNSEIKRFKRTANVGERHHPDSKIKPHSRPMELWEGRALITQWVSTAINDILAKDPLVRSNAQLR